MKPGTRRLLTLLFLFLLGCDAESDNENEKSTEGPPATGPCAVPMTTRDADGNLLVVATDALNYRFESRLELKTVPVRSGGDITFDWSGVTRDMLGHPFDPLKSVDMMALMLWRYDKERLIADFNDDNLDTSRLVVPGLIPTENAVSSARYLDLRSPNGNGVAEETLLEYVDTTLYPPEEHTYLMMVAEGTVFGHGTKMLTFFAPSPDETNTEVRLTDDSTTLRYTADLTSSKRIAIPPGTPDVILDWADNTKLEHDAMGRVWIPTVITEVLAAHYLDKSPEALAQAFLDLEQIADETWSKFLSAGQRVNLGALNTEADGSGAFFPGIDDVGTWIVALKCGSCANPAPLFLSILQPCP